MTLDLEPPRVPPLTTAERSRMRNQLMDRARPATRHPARRWIAPVVSVGAVAAVVAGTLAVTQKSPDTGVAGMATPEAKVGVDLGPVPNADLAKITAECLFPDEAAPADLVWSRHVRGITNDSTTLVAIARNTKGPIAQSRASQPPATRNGRGPAKGGAPSSAKLGYRFCMARIPPSAKLGAIGAVGRIDDKAWRAEPTAQRGLVALASTDGDFTNNLTTLQAWRLYRAYPDVAKVEARYVLDGKTGPWTSGVVHDGFAYTEVQAAGKFIVGQKLKTEVRAFDAQGKQIPVS
ncbi:hypothetical protein ACFV9C_12580 [Kribbella sp. NPDC059898]|uniref:hypothetical protein n=1 Tax=Kribbella sp. NPDC059898 TaxID=3346995 RepID=UPI00365864A4